MNEFMLNSYVRIQVGNFQGQRALLKDVRVNPPRIADTAVLEIDGKEILIPVYNLVKTTKEYFTEQQPRHLLEVISKKKRSYKIMVDSYSGDLKVKLEEYSDNKVVSVDKVMLSGNIGFIFKKKVEDMEISDYLKKQEGNDFFIILPKKYQKYKFLLIYYTIERENYRTKEEIEYLS